jgi:lipoprotein-anchoring transpeptidase ErfK/SrfK
MRRGLVLLLAGLALAAAAPASAQEPVIPNGVTIAGVAVGGLAEEQATAAVLTFFNRSLQLRLRRRSISVKPTALGARARVIPAVERALAASPGTPLGLAVGIYKWKLRRWTTALARDFHRDARNSTVYLRRLRPWITKAKPGRKLLNYPSRRLIRRALVHHSRGPLGLPTRTIRPNVTRSNFGPVIVIRRDSKRLLLYRGMARKGMRVIRILGVATGMAAYPTPRGRFTIVTKQRHPWWYPPDAGWAAGASPIPPGPGNPLGTRWMGLSAGGVGIHGTPDAASIGYSASHGCIRMRIPEAEWLFERVFVGTTVFIVGA